VIDLGTNDPGLKLSPPPVIFASVPARDIDGRCPPGEAGAAAVVLCSPFEDPPRREEIDLPHRISAGTGTFPEPRTCFPQPGGFHTGPEGYLQHMRKTKAAVNRPPGGAHVSARLGQQP